MKAVVEYFLGYSLKVRMIILTVMAIILGNIMSYSDPRDPVADWPIFMVLLAVLGMVVIHTGVTSRPIKRADNLIALTVAIFLACGVTTIVIVTYYHGIPASLIWTATVIIESVLMWVGYALLRPKTE